ncbi:MAG: HupE/UreJ family protein, partial [Chloroflexota bacterium]
MNYLLLDTLPGLEGALIGSIEPFLALSHVAMALVLGMLAATQRGKSYWAIPAAFITGTIIGMLVYFERGRWLVHHARDAVSFGLVVVCVMVIVGRSLPLLVTVAVAAASGSGYGYLLAMEIPLDGRHTVFIIMYTIGYASTFAALMGIGAVVTMVLRRHPR